MKTRHAAPIILFLCAMLAGLCALSCGSPQRDADEVISDSAIKSEVNYAFHKDGRVDQTKIKIDCLNGEVVLSGTLSSLEEVDRALAIAGGVRGVQTVKSNLKVRGGSKK